MDELKARTLTDALLADRKFRRHDPFACLRNFTLDSLSRENEGRYIWATVGYRGLGHTRFLREFEEMRRSMEANATQCVEPSLDQVRSAYTQMLEDVKEHPAMPGSCFALQDGSGNLVVSVNGKVMGPIPAGVIQAASESYADRFASIWGIPIKTIPYDDFMAPPGVDAEKFMKFMEQKEREGLFDGR